jgi:hypothetical protein
MQTVAEYIHIIGIQRLAILDFGRTLWGHMEGGVTAVIFAKANRVSLRGLRADNRGCSKFNRLLVELRVGERTW